MGGTMLCSVGKNTPVSKDQVTKWQKVKVQGLTEPQWSRQETGGGWGGLVKSDGNTADKLGKSTDRLILVDSEQTGGRTGYVYKDIRVYPSLSEQTGADEVYILVDWGRLYYWYILKWGLFKKTKLWLIKLWANWRAHSQTRGQTGVYSSRRRELQGTRNWTWSTPGYV